jgi:hypothetical protein
VFDAIAGEFGGVGGGKDDIALELGVDDLADLKAKLGNSSKDGEGWYHRGVCEADDEAVFGGGIFILCLGDETFAGIVVCLALPTSDTHTSAQHVLTQHSLSLSLARGGREGVGEIHL